jgi:NurA-like 5'-3' nuclease
VNYYQLWSRRMEQKRGEIESLLRGINNSLESVLRESKLKDILYNVPETKVADYADLSFGAVDGGEGLNELSGVAVYLIRASGLYTHVGSGGNFIRDLDLGVLPLDRNIKAKTQFRRATMEFEVATRLVREKKPDYILIDGSLQVSAEIDPLHINDYKIYISTFRNFLKACEKGGVQAVGVSEDSSSKGLINYLSDKNSPSLKSKNMMAAMTDASLMQFYVQRELAAEKDVCIATKQFLPVFEKGRDWAKKNAGIDAIFPTFYLKTGKFSRSLRVDFMAGSRDDEKMLDEKSEYLASMLAALSRVSKRYGYPLPLYLAHTDAELPGSLMEKTSQMIERQIFRDWQDCYVSMCTKKRRDSRPVEE